MATIGVFSGENLLSANGRDDYFVRVLTCPASNPDVREATCKGYPVGAPTVYKPTGILHDYGENQKMYFGLITGSQDNNLEGGVLRKNISDFAGEIDAGDGPVPYERRRHRPHDRQAAHDRWRLRRRHDQQPEQRQQLELGQRLRQLRLDRRSRHQPTANAACGATRWPR